MKKLILGLAVAAALGAPIASAYLGEIVGSFPSPYRRAEALASRGDVLYVLALNGRIYRCNPETGSVINEYPSPLRGGYTTGLGYSYGNYLWVGGDIYYYQGWVGRCDEATGSLYSSFTDPSNPLRGGLAIQGVPDRPGTFQAILAANTPPPGERRVYRYDWAGGRLGWFSYGPPYGTGDPAWDYKNGLVWLLGGSFLYGYTTRGSLVSSFAGPSSQGLWGATYYAHYLWISTEEPDLIWKVHCPGPVAVAPASLGRVKALFR